MESIDTEVCLESGKCDRKGCRIRGAHEWSLILKRYDQSGLTQTAFCAREGLKYGTLVAWLGRRRKKGDLSGKGSVTRSKFQELRVQLLLIRSAAALAGATRAQVVGEGPCGAAWWDRHG